MTLLCERCYSPIDPEHEGYFQLAHVSHADRAGHVTWNHASVHTDLCGPSVQLADVGEDRRAA